MDDKKIDKDEVFLTSIDGFVVALLVLQDENAYYYRNPAGGWELMLEKDFRDFLEDTTSHQIKPDAVDSMVELWDETFGVSEESGAPWQVEELEEYTV